ncbi:hypothetical protein SGPA1_20725 [Streptomyces misionensis JCM 4497]
MKRASGPPVPGRAAAWELVPSPLSDRPPRTARRGRPYRADRLFSGVRGPFGCRFRPGVAPGVRGPAALPSLRGTHRFEGTGVTHGRARQAGCGRRGAGPGHGRDGRMRPRPSGLRRTHGPGRLRRRVARRPGRRRRVRRGRGRGRARHRRGQGRSGRQERGATRRRHPRRRRPGRDQGHRPQHRGLRQVLRRPGRLHRPRRQSAGRGRGVGRERRPPRHRPGHRTRQPPAARRGTGGRRHDPALLTSPCRTSERPFG